jgi:hypothetical protein
MSKELKGPRISGVDEKGGYYQYPESDTPNERYRIANIPITSGVSMYQAYPISKVMKKIMHNFKIKIH